MLKLKLYSHMFSIIDLFLLAFSVFLVSFSFVDEAIISVVFVVFQIFQQLALLAILMLLNLCPSK